MFGGKKALPALRSVLAPEPLLRAAREHYVIERGASCELLHSGINDTYLIASSEQQLILRVYQHAWRTHAEIQWELSLLEHLEAESAPVSAPLRTRSGNRFALVLAPEGPRPVALFQYAAGKPQQGDAMAAVHARAYGRSLASVHLRMDTFEAAYPRFEIDLELLLSRPLKALEPRLTDRPQDLTYLQRIAEDVRDAIIEFDGRGLTTGLIHGAPTGGNAHLKPRGDFTFFDFDMAAPGWRTYDFAAFRWGGLKATNRRKADENFGAFLEGYREVRGLSRVDEEAVPPFVAAHEIWRLGMAAASAASRGHSFMNDQYFDQSIHFLHDWYKESMAYS